MTFEHNDQIGSRRMSSGYESALVDEDFGVSVPRKRRKSQYAPIMFNYEDESRVILPLATVTFHTA